MVTEPTATPAGLPDTDRVKVRSVGLGFFVGFCSGFFFVVFVFCFCLFRATPLAYGGSQVRGQIGVVAAGLHHSNAGSEPRL